MCFRCGFAGHFPDNCKAETTSAGHPAAPLATGTKSKNTLVGPNNRFYCFNWAKDSSCSFGNNCNNVHACSLCGDTSHGARGCKSRSDPRSVCTPIDPDKAESLLRSFNIYNKWSHVITGLREGFDVGIKSLPTETILFREPRLISSQPRFHIFVHGERTCKWSLLPTIYPVGAGSLNRAISHFTHWARPKTQLSRIQVNTRPILPPQPSNYPSCQCWRMLRRLSHSLGHLRDNYNLDSFSTPRLSSSDIRHISSVPTGPHSSRPAECLLPILGRESEGRSSSNAWAYHRVLGSLGALQTCLSIFITQQGLAH